MRNRLESDAVQGWTSSAIFTIVGSLSLLKGLRSKQRPSRSKRTSLSSVSIRPVGTIMVLLAVLMLTACGKPEEDKDKKGAEQEIKPIAVETMTIKTSPFSQYIEFPGVAEPIESRRIAAESSGRVLSAPFEDGEKVKKGALLLKTDAKMTRAQIRVIDSQIRTAKREYARVKKLAEQGLATPQQLDQANSQLEQVRLSRKQAQVGASMATVRSPFTGHVSTKYIKKGEFIGPGQPIVELIDYETIVMKVTVPESDIGAVKVGEPVDVYFPASKKVHKGIIKHRGLRVAQPTQTFPIEVHIENKKLEIIPGMRARVRVPKTSMDAAVIVPRDAILEGFARREAMVVKDRNGQKGHASLRVVEFGPSRGNEVVITKGLKAGDQLIVKGHRGVVDGTLLRIVREVKP